MIHKIKTVTYEVRSHGHCSTISNKGELIYCPALRGGIAEKSRPYVKMIIWHLQDVLKVLNKLERERQARKEK